jgi:hypothetical protein
MATLQKNAPPPDLTELQKQFRSLQREYRALRERHAQFRSWEPKASAKHGGEEKAAAGRLTATAAGGLSEQEILRIIREIIKEISGEASLRKPSDLALGANVKESRLVDRVNKRILKNTPSGRKLDGVGSSEKISHLAQVVFDIQNL